MKSKFLIIISFLGLLAFTACEPNEEIYEQYEAEYVKPYSETFSITLTDADYATVKSENLNIYSDSAEQVLISEIDTYKSFSSVRSAEKYIPAFLSKSYLALDSGSRITVDYNFDNALILTDDKYIILSEEDYTAIGGDVATNGYFDENNNPLILISGFLSNKFPEAVKDDKQLVTYKFFENEETFDESIYFVFNGTAWVSDATAYIISKEDYNSMGISGDYLNFSSSKRPEIYLPVFFGSKFPYETAEGTTKTVIYVDYMNSITSRVINTFKIVDGKWLSIFEKESQFIHNGEAWFFDPTVQYSMNGDDYQIIVDYIINHPTLNVYVGYDNRREFYYGVNAKYSDYDIFIPDRVANDPLGTLTGLSDEEIMDTLWNRVNESLFIFLDAKFSDAQPFSNGIPVYYEIYYGTFEPTLHTYYTRFLCTEVGKFEYVEGPIFVK